jgi:hypothetical protein
MSESVWARLAAEVESFTSGIRGLPVLPPVSPEEIRGALQACYGFAAPVPLDRIVASRVRTWDG